MTLTAEGDDGAIGYGKSAAAVIGGAVATLVVGALALAGLHLPDAMSNALQTLITLYFVYRVPHSFGAKK